MSLPFAPSAPVTDALSLPHHRLESLTLERSLLFNDLHIDFPDGLIVLFGARGTGKSALLAILAWLLRATLLPQSQPVNDSHVKATLGGGKATLRVVSMFGVRYRIEARWGETPQVYDEAGRLVNVSVNGPLFKAEVYPQKIIEEIGRDEAAKRALIDKFAEAETLALEAEIARVEALLAQSAEEQERLKARIEEEDRGILEIPAILEALAGLDAAAGAHAADAAREGERKRARGDERRAMAEVGGAVEAARVEMAEIAAEAARRIGKAIEAAFEGGPAGALFRAAHAAGHGAAAAIDGAWGKLAADLTAFEGAIAAAARDLKAVHDAEDEAYYAFLARADASRARAAERQTLHLRLEELSARKRRFDELQRALEERATEQAALKKEHVRLARAVSACRGSSGARVEEDLAGRVKITIQSAVDAKAYRELAGRMLKGCPARPDIDGIVAAFRPARLAEIIRTDDAAAIEAIDRLKTGKGERAGKVLATLRASGLVDELETFRLLDVVSLALDVLGKPIDSEKASVGQRCTCVVEMLLLPAPAVLIADQLEDHLDGSFIYERLVKTLLDEKENRQVLLVSHHPNIPALARAELVVLMGVDEVGAHMAAHGDYRRMAGELEGWMEGGAEAFLKRAELYGHLPAKGESEGETEGEE